MDGKRAGVLFSVCASLMFGLSPVLVTLTLNYTNIETQNVLFNLFASIFFAAFIWAFKKKRALKVILKNWREITLVSAIVAAGSLLFTYGILVSGPTNATFVIQFTLIFTILLGVVFLKERLSKFEVLGMLISLSGLFVLSYGNVEFEILSTAVLLAASALFAAANFLSKVYVKNIDPLSLTGGRAIFVFVILLVYALALGKLDFALPVEALGYSALGAVTGVALSFVFFFKALEIFEVSKTMIIRSMEPFLTALFSFAILALAPTANQLAGGAIIVAGVILLSLTKQQQ
ncbi:MAG: DMT family transporter [Candidatus Bathyarchaeota archaeon]|nr:DMT family transporter [Candidatus Bathyarchaeota archaeon]